MDESIERNLLHSCWPVLGILAAALFSLVLVGGCSSQYIGDGEPGAPQIRQPAPDFTLADLEGNQVSLSDFRGKTVFLNFWATWCPPCRAEMPEIEAIHQEYKERDVVVIGVDLLEQEDTIRQYVQQGGYTWTFVIDTTGQVGASYRVAALPTSVFVDSEGIIRGINVGAMTKRSMEAKLVEAMQ